LGGRIHRVHVAVIHRDLTPALSIWKVENAEDESPQDDRFVLS